MIRTRSIRMPASPGGGLRLLITRYRGRGIPRQACDVWMPNLAPSEKLLRAFQAGRITWAVFSLCYRREIFGEDRPEPGNSTIRNRGQKFTLRLLQRLARNGSVTLLCHCAEDEPHCHRHLLRRMLAAKI